MKKYTAIALLLILSSCTHTVNLRGFDSSRTPAKAVENKSVAIVIDKAKIQDGHSTRSDVYTYEFKQTTDSIVEALKARLASARKVDVVSQESPAKEGYDFYFYPEFTIRSVNDFWTMGCLLKFNLVVKRNEKVIASESAEAKRNFFSSNNSEEKCKIAMSEAFEKVTAKVFSAL